MVSDLDARGADVGERGADLVGGLAEAEHDAGLDPAGVAPLVAPPGGFGEQRQGAVVAAAGTGLAIEARHRLRVVREDLRRRCEHDVEGVGDAAEVGRQDLDRAGRTALVNRPDHRRPVPGAAVRQVVAVDRGDDGVPQAHRGDRRGDVAGLGRVHSRIRPARGHRAEAAAPGADLAEDHERRRAVLAPALVDVGALGLFADRVQVQSVDELADLVVLRRRLRA